MKKLMFLKGILSSLLVILLSVFSEKLLAQQLVNYTFSTNTSTTFSALSSATTASPLSGSLEDGAFNNIPIGFDFWYMGKRYTQLSAGTNGFLVLGDVVPSTSNYVRLNNLVSGSVVPVLAPLWDDNELLANKVTYRTTGVVGSRIFTIQYLNIRWSTSVSGNNGSMSFQVRLEEGTNRITYHYKQENSNVSSASASVGLNAIVSGVRSFISVTSTSSPAISRTSETTTLNSKFANNRQLIFTPSLPVSPSNLTFSNIDTNSLSLQWQDNSSDESGFVIYNSTDGINYNYYGETLANVTSLVASGLTKGQNYFWKVHSIREILSEPIEGEKGTRGDIPVDFSISYPFSGGAQDASGNGYHGTLQNGPVSTEDRFGILNSAYDFNGTNQYISTSKLIASPGPQVFTYSLWIKTTTQSGGKIFGFSGNSTGQSTSYDRHLYMLDDGRLTFGIYLGAYETITTASSFNDGNWHNVVCTLGPSGMRMYVDGVLIGIKANTTTAESVPGYWRIGYDNLSGWPNVPSSYYFKGVIDDISVFPRQLNSSDIESIIYKPQEDFAYWKNITLNTSNIISGTVSNFPYLISLTDPDLKLNTEDCDLSTGVLTVGKVRSSTGADINFTTLNGERLSHEIVKYVPSTGELLAWIKLPFVSATSNSVIKMQFGKSDVTPNVSSEVWTDYRSVFHFDENVYNGSTVDATNLALVGTVTNMSAANHVTGMVGKAYIFNGDTQKISVQTSSATDLTGNYTLSAWVNSTNPSIDQKILTNQLLNSRGYKLGIFNSVAEVENNGVPNRPGAGVTGTPLTMIANTWYHVMGVYEGTTLRTYVNGVLRQIRTTGVSAPLLGGNLNIGIGEGGNQYPFKGSIDEVRVSTSVRDANWSMSEYRNQLNPTSQGVLPSILSVGNLQANLVLASQYTGLYFTFNGSVNNNFNGAGNYTSNATNLNSLPSNGAFVSVVVPSGKSPSVTENAVVNSLAVQQGGTLAFNGFTVTVNCNVYDNGVINGSSGTLTFAGSNNTQVYFGGNNLSSIGNLVISKSSGGILELNKGLMDVYSGLTISNGANLQVLDATTLTLKSNSTMFANVSPLTGGSVISGNIKVESFYTGGVGKRGTRMVSSAINESSMRSGGRSIYQQMKEHMVITGPQNGGFDPGNSARPYAVTLTKYNESALSNQSQFTSIPNIATGTVPTELPGSAFFLFYRGDRSNYTVQTASNSPKLNDDYVPESFSASLFGPLNQGNVSIPITHSNLSNDAYNGFNVVGNPYAATIDWEKVFATNSTLVENQIRIIQPGGAIMTRTKSGSNPAVVVNAIGNSANAQFIQPGQGFYIKKNNAGTSNFVFNESHKAVTATPNRLLSAPQKERLDYFMSTEAPTHEKQAVVLFFNIVNGSNTNKDETAIVFKEGFSANLDENDAFYVTNNSVILGSLSADGHNLAINYLPELNDKSNVKLMANSSTSGSYSLNFTNLLSLGRYKAILKDKYLSKDIDLSLNPNYSFEINRNNASTYGGNRFELSFVEGPPLTFNLTSFDLTQVEEKVKIQFTTGSEITTEKVEVETSVSGANFLKIGELAAANLSNSPKSYEIFHDKPVQGINYYRLKQIYSDGTYTYSNTQQITFRKLEFQNFQLIRDGKSIQLKWSSVSENNTLNFQVEKSINNAPFRNIGQVVAAGQSSTISNYSFTDSEPNEGTLSYRLIAQFSDASPTTSKIESYDYRSSYLSDFTLLRNESNVALSWKPVSNSSNLTYVVEKSLDGAKFTALLSMPSTAVNELGISEFVDVTPSNGINYYRIKQVFGNTDLLYSAVKSVDFRLLYLRNLKAKQAENNVLVTWSNNNSENQTTFEIQRSFEGSTFETISTVPANRNNIGSSDYQYLDSKPKVGLNLYRVKLNYVDGAESYSEVVEASWISNRVINLQLAQTSTGVKLNWQALNDEDQTTFHIERSYDGLVFTRISSLPSIISSNISDYHLEDLSPEYRIVYYRIVEEFSNGSFNASKIEQINHILRDVSLSNFEVSQTAEGIALRWVTSSECSLTKFVIERSVDGIIFESISEIKGIGSVSKLSDYLFVDKSKKEGINHYRLKYLFIDGTSAVSKIEKFNLLSFKLENFEIQKVPNQVKLTWKASNELNAESYLLERSTNASEYVTVSETPVNGGISSHTYLQLDANALKGLNYYRLNLKYKDGSRLILPVKAFEFQKFEGYLTTFEASKLGFKTILKWSTSEDTYISKFEVEKSVDGSTFERIHVLPILNNSKNGNSYTYEYGVNFPLNKEVYYRIKLESKESEIDRSQIRSVYNSETKEVVDESVLVYPNPTSSFIEIASQELDVTVNVLNIAGSLVKSYTFDRNSSIKMDVSSLNSGLYYLEIRQNDKAKRLVGRGKFIKN